MISMKQIGDVSPEDLKKAKMLYYHAFPKNERRSFPEMVENRLGGTEVWVLYDDLAFIGMACILDTPDIAHIIYLAIDESLRGRGYGSKALELLHNSKPNKRIMVDIEIPDARAENAKQRQMRKAFYLKAGYEETAVKYEWRHENYEILSYGGQISEAEYDNFWKVLHK